MPTIYIPLRPVFGAIVMGSMGIGIACAGWFWQSRLDDFVGRSEQVDGEVVAIEKRNLRNQYLSFRYVDRAGSIRASKSIYPLSGYAVGDKIRVAYDPNVPSDALIPEAVTPAFGPLVLTGFGAAFALVALYAGVSLTRQKTSGR